MPEQLTRTQRELRDRSETLARTLCGLPALDAGALREAVVEASRSAGLFGLSQPAEHGGMAASQLEQTLVREALAAHRAPGRQHAFGPGPGVLAGVQGRLQRDYLEPMLAGTRQSAFAFTERPEGPATTVVRQGDGWRLDGHKSYVTGGGQADCFAVVAALQAPETGAALLMVDADAVGVQVSETFRSLDGSEHVALRFDNVALPADAMVGQPGEGLPRAQRQIGDVRLRLAAEACGLMQWCCAHLENHLRQPRQDGSHLGDREGVRLRYADLRIEAFAARSMLYRTARLADADENIINEGIACKVFATEALGRCVDTALQLEGGQALLETHPLAQLYREVRALRLAEGASDVLRLQLVRGRLELDKGRL